MVKSLDREISQQLLVLFAVLTGSGGGGLGGLITGTGAPDIFIKHKVGLLSSHHLPVSHYEIPSLSQGTPSSDQLDFEPRLDPQQWNKHFNQRKALRFSLGRNEEIKARPRENDAWDSLRRIPEKPSLKQFIKKYSSTTMTPIDLIR